MAPDERERIFDKALARHLGAGRSREDSANSSARESGVPRECADAETLAAYHERSLLPEEMNFWKGHIVGCANCQAVLAHLEATDEIPVEAAEEEKVLSQAEPALLASASNESHPAAPRMSSVKSRRVRFLRGARWQWLAPAGALAAGLLVWIALHENQPLAPRSPKQAQVATKQVASPPAPSTSTAVREMSPSPKAAPQKPQSAANEFAGADARSASAAGKSDGKEEYRAEVSPSKSMADKESRLRKDQGSSSSVDLLAAQEQLDRDAKTAAGRRQENAEVQLQTQAANAQSQNQLNTSSPKVPGPAPLGQMEAKKMKAASAAPAAPPPAPGGVGGAVSSYNSSASLEVARAISNPRLISPPGSNVIWLAGRSGLIEFSRDGGSSWSRQTSGVLAELLTGSAPSDKVCWIVGRVGTILLTTDGGAHWKLISSPFLEDLGGIRAMDALHATIWNARNTKSFETTDGGLTWRSIPAP
jgi:cytoskeletal protein RodZ